MTRRRAFVALGLALFFAMAVTISYAVVRGTYTDGYVQALAVDSALHANDKAHLLRMLRRGDVAAAISSLELGLDGDIFGPESFSFEDDQRLNLYPSARNPIPNLMSYVADYRDEYPSTETDRKARALISRTLRKYPRQKCTPTATESAPVSGEHTKTPPN